jgi:hypothetical protein
VKPPKAGLFIDDMVPKIPLAKVFDPKKHSFNPLAGIDYKKARAIADVLYTIAPQGENALTVRNGKRALLKALLKAERLDQVRGESVLLIKDKKAAGATVEDAPARYERLAPGTVGFGDYVQAAIAWSWEL